MTSILQTLHKRTPSLPLSHPSSSSLPSLRHRISAAPATDWALRRTQSLSYMGSTAGSSIKSWWTWGWDWILSRKPIFAVDLEMNEEEKRNLGFQNRGSLRHIFYKLKSEIKKIVRSDDVERLPMSFKCNSKDLDGGMWRISAQG